ncbi:MAG: nitrate/nitrite transporter NrtS [Betaproteobacteria bacterium]|nr:nitrate/nitrite transporter NrtS [Betaproteobacteria bacterium]
MQKLLATACERSIVSAAIRVALVVGTILNVINQGGRMMDGLSPSWFHVGLNYLVPYCVSSYSAARNQMRNHRNPIEAKQ